MTHPFPAPPRADWEWYFDEFGRWCLRDEDGIHRVGMEHVRGYRGASRWQWTAFPPDYRRGGRCERTKSGSHEDLAEAKREAFEATVQMKLRGEP